MKFIIEIDADTTEELRITVGQYLAATTQQLLGVHSDEAIPVKFVVFDDNGNEIKQCPTCNKPIEVHF